MQRQRAFTFIEMIVAITLVALFLCLLLPTSHGARRSSRQMENQTQIRGIHQSMVMYAYGNGGHFPGLKRDGTDGDLAVENRFQILLEGNYFPGDYAASPVENKTPWTTGAVTAGHYSYAMLQIPTDGGRRREWADTLNSEAIVMSDRNVGTAGAPLSIHGAPPPGIWGCSSPGSGSGAAATHWRGGVAYNDNHVEFVHTHVLPTAYANGQPVSDPYTRHAADDLFTAAGDDDAMLIHSGN